MILPDLAFSHKPCSSTLLTAFDQNTPMLPNIPACNQMDVDLNCVFSKKAKKWLLPLGVSMKILLLSQTFQLIPNKLLWFLPGHSQAFGDPPVPIWMDCPWQRRSSEKETALKHQGCWVLSSSPSDKPAGVSLFSPSAPPQSCEAVSPLQGTAAPLHSLVFPWMEQKIYMCFIKN